MAFDPKEETYIVYITCFNISNSHIYFFKETEIKAFTCIVIPIIIFNKYTNFTNIFLPNLAT